MASARPSAASSSCFTSTLAACHADQWPDTSAHSESDATYATLLIHPVVLGEGARLFDESSPLTEFTLTSSVATGTGVLIATYERA